MAKKKIPHPTFKEMRDADLKLLEELSTASRKKVAERHGVTKENINQRIYRIKNRYKLYRTYVNPIANLIGRHEHLKRAFLSMRAPTDYFEDETEMDEMT